MSGPDALKRVNVLVSHLQPGVSDSEKVKVALVVGVGDGIGSACIRRFSREGFVVVGVRRNAEKSRALEREITENGGTCVLISADARKEDGVTAVFQRCAELGSLEVVVFNIGANVMIPVAETSAQKFYKVWEMAAFAAFLVGRQAARVMAPRRRGAVFFTSATAALRGSAGFAAFASAKFAKRGFVMALSHELAKQGVHVAHVVVDGPVDTPWIRENLLMDDEMGSRLVSPDSVAAAFWQLYTQTPDAWTFEMDLRSSAETPWWG